MRSTAKKTTFYASDLFRILSSIKSTARALFKRNPNITTSTFLSQGADHNNTVRAIATPLSYKGQADGIRHYKITEHIKPRYSLRDLAKKLKLALSKKSLCTERHKLQDTKKCTNALYSNNNAPLIVPKDEAITIIERTEDYYAQNMPKSYIQASRSEHFTKLNPYKYDCACYT